VENNVLPRSGVIVFIDTFLSSVLLLFGFDNRRGWGSPTLMVALPVFDAFSFGKPELGSCLWGMKFGEKEIFRARVNADDSFSPPQKATRLPLRMGGKQAGG